MKWINILFLVAGGISVFIYVLALFRWFQIKWYFQNTLPYSEQECIKVFPRYPLWYYKMRSTPWNDRIAKDLVKRNQILMEYDKAKAEQLVHAEKQMFFFYDPGRHCDDHCRHLPDNEIAKTIPSPPPAD